MPRPLRQPVIALATLGLVLLCGVATASDTPRDTPQKTSQRFELTHVDPQDATITLRSLAGTRHVETVEESALLVTDSAAGLELAAKVLELIDVDADGAAALDSTVLDLGDDDDADTVLTRFPVDNARAREVVTALRRDLSIRHLMVSADPSMILIRATPETTEAAVDLVESIHAVQ